MPLKRPYKKMPLLVIFKEERIFCVLETIKEYYIYISFFFSLSENVLVCRKWETKLFKG